LPALIDLTFGSTEGIGGADIWACAAVDAKPTASESAKILNMAFVLSDDALTSA
jgi:hypothetical protein